MTKYLVLRSTVGQNANWEEVDSVDAVSAEQARKKVAASQGEGTYVAVPARSFHPTTYTTKTTVKIEEVKSE